MAVERLAALAVEEMGPAPADYAFLALGSGGRQEQTLGSDQDNAIVHAGRLGEPWFQAFGEKLCGWLADMGVPPCPGGVMASNPAWCAPLGTWQEYFARWIREPDSQELRDFNIFFDFRCVAGSKELARALRGSIAAMLPDHPPFFLHLAQDALSKRLPPLFSGGMLRELLRTGPAELNVKEAMAPIVRFARLYALRHGIGATATIERLAGLGEAGVLAPALHDQIVRTWWFLSQLRLQSQEESSRTRGAASDLLNTRGLSAGDEAMLRAAAAQVVLLQKRISFDFLGSAL
jgi:CBS domain-containing protein